MMFGAQVFAQSEGGKNRPEEFGVFVGNTLPSGITGADEIFPLWGVRYSHPTGKGQADGGGTYLDFGGLAGRGEGVEWQGVFTDISIHIPVETLIGHAGLGVDLTRYKTSTTDTATIGGFNFTGGVATKIGSEMMLRFDMKLNSKPGTSLYFALGLVFGFGGESSADGN